MWNSEKYKHIESRLGDMMDITGSLRPAMIMQITKELMALSKSTENPDELPADIRDTYHRLYG